MTVEDKYVNSFDETRIAWTEVGSSPHLQDTDPDNIYTSKDGAQEGDFGFPNSAGSGTITSVKLRFETRLANAAGGNTADVYVWNGSSWNNVGYLSPAGTSYGWEEIDVSSLLNSWTKINGCLVYVELYRVDRHSLYVRRGVRRVDYTPSGPTPGWNEVQFDSEPPSAGWNKVKYVSEPPTIGAWNEVAYAGE